MHRSKASQFEVVDKGLLTERQCAGAAAGREDLMERLRLLSVCVIIAGWLAVTSGSKAQDGKVLQVALAGTMEQVISRQIGPAFTAATGYTLDITRQSSVLLANRIASGGLTPDVYISSDANVMGLVMGPANNDRAH